MFFKIQRASDYNKKPSKPPCNGAKWTNIGWEIEISSLEEMMKLVEREGEIILDRDYIRIYDDYVE
jgi:hypothetical protein